MSLDLVALTLAALLLGAAIMANVTDGPMREHRGSWVTHALSSRPHLKATTLLVPVPSTTERTWRATAAMILGSRT